MQTPGLPHSASFAQARQVLTAAPVLLVVSSQIGLVVELPPAFAQSPFVRHPTQVPG
jgi:hypothetical protein